MSEIDILKNEVVTEMFVDPADHDYVVSRWCYQNCLFGSFFWNAAQAIEKYLKASLLLNGRSSKKFGHDLVRLYDAVTEYADDLLPDGLERPEAFDGRPFCNLVLQGRIFALRQFVFLFNQFHPLSQNGRERDFCKKVGNGAHAAFRRWRFSRCSRARSDRLIG